MWSSSLVTLIAPIVAILLQKYDVKAAPTTPVCVDTPNWFNGYALANNGLGFTCQNYLTNGWCANGAATAGNAWTLGGTFNFPEQNCCICGKIATTTTTVAPTAAVCANTPNWSNGVGFTCQDYLTYGWCANGAATAGNAGTLGATLNFPEQNCCICGKSATTTTTTTTVAPTAAVCANTPNWSNGIGFTCQDYLTYGWCANGAATAGNAGTLGATLNFPEQNCCICGKSATTTTTTTTVAPTAAVCANTPNWSNGVGSTCEDYLALGWCANGAATAGNEWTLGATFQFPEQNCCICGKAAAATTTTVAPTAPVCVDTPNWFNGYTGANNVNGYTCQDYLAYGWCANEAATAGNAWALGVTNNYPEDNCCICGKGGSGAFRFANYLQDHMVLQRGPQSAVVWGFGAVKKSVTLTMNGQTYTTISGSELANQPGISIWSVTLNPVFDEGPFDIYVSQSLANGTVVTIMLHDVLFGDVWICSGQSNMQFTVDMIFNATYEIANAGNYPKIRVFTAALTSIAVPVEELLGISLQWSIASAQSIGGPDWTYMSAVCWIYGRSIQQALGGRPIGLIATAYGGTLIQPWMPPTALGDCGIAPFVNGSVVTPSPSPSSPTGPTYYTHLFNAMIYPFTRTVIYGVIWYQGESNALSSSDNYTCLFQKLIQYWRQTWNQRTNGITDIQFPFGFVQLSTYRNDSTIVGQFPWIRWHQTFDVGYAPNNVVPKVFMAVALDLRDDPNSIHPRYKQDVGYRLSRAGLAVAYGQQVEFQGPIVQNVNYSSGSGTVNITYTAVTNIELRNLNGFEVCCQGGQCSDDTLWVPANVSSKNALTIALNIPSSCVGQQLYGLRYLWRETPCLFKQAAIYSYTDSNLPSPPYLKLF